MLTCLLLSVRLSKSHLLPGRELQEKRGLMQYNEYRREIWTKLRETLATQCNRKLHFIDKKLKVG